MKNGNNGENNIIINQLESQPENEGNKPQIKSHDKNTGSMVGKNLAPLKYSSVNYRKSVIKPDNRIQSVVNEQILTLNNIAREKNAEGEQKKEQQKEDYYLTFISSVNKALKYTMKIDENNNLLSAFRKLQEENSDLRKYQLTGAVDANGENINFLTEFNKNPLKSSNNRLPNNSEVFLHMTDSCVCLRNFVFGRILSLFFDNIFFIIFQFAAMWALIELGLEIHMLEDDYLKGTIFKLRCVANGIILVFYLIVTGISVYIIYYGGNEDRIRTIFILILVAIIPKFCLDVACLIMALIKKLHNWFLLFALSSDTALFLVEGFFMWYGYGRYLDVNAVELKSLETLDEEMKFLKREKRKSDVNEGETERRNARESRECINFEGKKSAVVAEKSLVSDK